MVVNVGFIDLLGPRWEGRWLGGLSDRMFAQDVCMFVQRGLDAACEKFDHTEAILMGKRIDSLFIPWASSGAKSKFVIKPKIAMVNIYQQSHLSTEIQRIRASNPAN